MEWTRTNGSLVAGMKMKKTGWPKGSTADSLSPRALERKKVKNCTLVVIKTESWTFFLFYRVDFYLLNYHIYLNEK